MKQLAMKFDENRRKEDEKMEKEAVSGGGGNKSNKEVIKEKKLTSEVIEQFEKDERKDRLLSKVHQRHQAADSSMFEEKEREAKEGQGVEDEDDLTKQRKKFLKEKEIVRRSLIFLKRIGYDTDKVIRVPWFHHPADEQNPHSSATATEAK
jgi:transcriptional regulator of met regulon